MKCVMFVDVLVFGGLLTMSVLASRSDLSACQPSWQLCSRVYFCSKLLYVAQKAAALVYSYQLLYTCDIVCVFFLPYCFVANNDITPFVLSVHQKSVSVLKTCTFQLPRTDEVGLLLG